MKTNSTVLFVVSVIALGMQLSACRQPWMNVFTGSKSSEDSSNGTQVLNLEPLMTNPKINLSEAIELASDRTLYLSKRNIFYREGDRFYPILTNGYPEMVGLAPDKRHFAYIEPAEFEQIGNLYVFNFENKSIRRLTDHAGENPLTVKDAKWLNSRWLYYIEGYAFGTVSRGGALYRVDVNALNRDLIFDQSPPNETPHREVSHFEFAPNGLIRLTLAIYDENRGLDRQKILYINRQGKIVNS